MKKTNFLHVLLGITTSSALVFSCISEEINDAKGNSESINLVTPSEQTVAFKIGYNVPEGYRVAFDVYAENPFVVTADGFAKNPEVSPIVVAMTDENGQYNISRVISGGVKEVYVASSSAGAPALLHGTIQNGMVAPVEVDMSTLVQEQAVAESRAAFDVTYLGGWNTWGRPDYIDKNATFHIENSELRSISCALPEWRKVKADYTTADFVSVEKEAEVWVSLLSEKSLFNNALGYFCYTDGMSKDDISEIIAFPNANISLLPNCGLHRGEYIKLKYMDPQTKELKDKFPAGTRIGWVMHRSGFQSLTGKVNNGAYQFYSNNEWNPETEKKNHTAMFTTTEGNLVIGFEDVYNDAFLADNDCNDIVLHVASCPNDAIQATTQIPEASDEFEEEVDVIQPLKDIIEVAESDALANDIQVASKSALLAKDGNVYGVRDILYLATSASMNNLVNTTYSSSDMERKVVVRTTVKFSRAAQEESKGRTVVRTTVKNTTWEVEERDSRCVFYYEGDNVAELLQQLVEHYRLKLADGACIRLEIDMTFEPVPYDEFVSSINVPPYSPFIVDVEDVEEE